MLTILLAATFLAMTSPGEASLGEASLELDAVEARAAASGGAGKRAYVRRVFSEIAPRYDLLNHVLSLNIDRGWRRAALIELGWQRQPMGTYLDLCAGTLDVGALLARSTGFRGRVIGAEYEPAKTRRTGQHGSHVECAGAEIEIGTVGPTPPLQFS